MTTKISKEDWDKICRGPVRKAVPIDGDPNMENPQIGPVSFLAWSKVKGQEANIIQVDVPYHSAFLARQNAAITLQIEPGQVELKRIKKPESAQLPEVK